MACRAHIKCRATRYRVGGSDDWYYGSLIESHLPAERAWALINCPPRRNLPASGFRTQDLSRRRPRFHRLGHPTFPQSDGSAPAAGADQLKSIGKELANPQLWPRPQLRTQGGSIRADGHHTPRIPLRAWSIVFCHRRCLSAHLQPFQSECLPPSSRASREELNPTVPTASGKRHGWSIRT